MCIDLSSLPHIYITCKSLDSINLFFADASGNPVTQSVVSVTDSSGNPVTGSFNLYKLYTYLDHSDSN